MTITQQEVKTLFEYRDGELYWKVKPLRSRVTVGSIAGNISKNGKYPYRRITINQVTYGAHRLIWLFHHGYLPTRIDHIDNDTTNNDLENLRECTQQQNSYNKVRKQSSSSKYKGVHITPHNIWRVRILKGDKYISVGSFKNEEEAARAYDKKALELHGEFALCNFPDES